MVQAVYGSGKGKGRHWNSGHSKQSQREAAMPLPGSAGSWPTNQQWAHWNAVGSSRGSRGRNRLELAELGLHGQLSLSAVLGLPRVALGELSLWDSSAAPWARPSWEGTDRDLPHSPAHRLPWHCAELPTPRQLELNQSLPGCHYKVLSLRTCALNVRILKPYPREQS